MYRVLSKSFRLNVYLHLVHIINKHVELLLDKKWSDVGVAIGILNGVIAERCRITKSRLSAGQLQQPTNGQNQ